jgi:hypothetical protein
MQGTALRAADEVLVVPRMSWRVVQSRIQRLWVVRDASHHSLIGQTRSGKSYLMRYGILPTCAYDNVIIIDGKGWDPTLDGLGRVVRKFPNRAQLMSRQWMEERRRPGSNWFRLVTSDNREQAIEQVEEALRSAYGQGDWIVIIDELRYVTDPKEPCLGLKGLYEQIVLRGGGHGTGIVSLTQEPRWVPSSFYTQSSFYWFSKVQDERALQRISEVGSSRQLLPLLAKVPRREWIYMDDLDDERFWALTKVGQ